MPFVYLLRHKKVATIKKIYKAYSRTEARKGIKVLDFRNIFKHSDIRWQKHCIHF